MNNYNEYKEIKNKQNAIVDELSDKLNSYPKDNLGMVIESARVSSEFRELKTQYQKEFKKLQDINREGMKKFKKEIRDEYESKRIKRIIGN